MNMAAIHLVYFSTSHSNGLSDDDQAPAEVCIANISPYERRKRVNFAILQFSVTLVVLGVLIVLGLDPLWRLPLFFLFSASTTSLFQSLDKT
jgi:hypothetical protein